MLSSELPPWHTLTDIEGVSSFLATSWSIPGQQIAVFAGAGISIPPPSSLPSAIEIIRNLTTALCAHPNTSQYVGSLPEAVLASGTKMEVLFEIIERNAGSKLRELFHLFEADAPNLYHYFLARLLEVGAISHIVTTNFDCLIERASHARLTVLATEAEHASCPSPALYKIHGTVDRPETMIAVLNQVSRGLPANKTRLLRETLERACIVIGWSDDDIDLTPPFFQVESELLLWFVYDPQSPRVINFGAHPHPQEIPGVQPKVLRILQKNRGICIACDPLRLFLDVWHKLKPLLGGVPILESTAHPNVAAAISAWADSLPLSERLLIVGDMLHRLTRWDEAQQLFKQAETLAADASQRFNIHNKLGLCFTHLSSWRDAFHYYDLCLADKGYKGTIEVLLEERPRHDPQLAVLYGNVGMLLGKIGRTHDSAICYEQDALLCARFGLGEASLACSNLAVVLGELGDFERAAEMAERAKELGLEEGNLDAIEGAHQVFAYCAAVSGDMNRSENELSAALDIAYMLSRPNAQIAHLKNFAQHCYTIGNIKAALQYLDEALKLAEHYKLTSAQAEVWMVKGVTLKESAVLKYPVESLSAAPELQESLAAYNRSIDLLTNKDADQKLRSVILTNRGLLFYLLGDYERAYSELWESLQIRTNLLDEIGQATILNNLGLVLLASENGLEQSESSLRKALSIYDHFGHQLGRCQVLHDLAGVHITKLHRALRRGKLRKLRSSADYKKALAYLNESLQLAIRLQAPGKIKQAKYNLRALDYLGS
jgi:tetratricopeptide (TPR) repeat protein